MKKKIRVGLIAIVIALLIANLTRIDYSNFTLSNNSSPFIQVGVGILLIINFIIQIRYDKKQQANLTDNS